MARGNKNKVGTPAGKAAVEDQPEKRKLDAESSDVGVAEKKRATGEKKPKKEDDKSAETTVSLSMSCPQSRVGGIIGKRGYVIAEIMRQSQCKVQIDQNFPEGFPRQIALSGSQEGIFIAVKLINEIINGAEGATPSFLPHTKEEPFYISSDKVGSVIGHRGANINEILSRTGCRIQIIQENQPEGEDRLVTFQGTPKEIAEAKKLINLIISEGINALLLSAPSLPTSTGPILGAPGGLNSVEEDIMPDKVGVVIGTKGVTINKISKKSGARILMNQKFPTGHPHKVIYSGTPQQIELAKHLVYTVVNYGDAALEAELNRGSGGAPGQGQVMQEINVFQSQMVRLLGPHGSNVSDVQNRCGVKINIDTTPVMLPNSSIGPSGFPEATNKVTVIGSSEAVQMAVKLLYEFIGILVAAPPSMPGFAQPQPPMGSTAMYGQQQGQAPAAPGYPQQYQPQQAVPPQYGQPMYQQQQSAYGSSSSSSSQPQYAPPQQMQAPQTPTSSTPGVSFGPSGAYQQPSMQGQQQQQPYQQASTVNTVGYAPPPNPVMGAQYPPTYPTALPAQTYPQQLLQQQPMVVQQQPAPVAPVPQQQHHYQPQAQQQQTPPVVEPQTQTLALGEDGTAGQLEPPVMQADGSHQQVAEIKSGPPLGRLLGARGGNVPLIKSKSGAAVQVQKADASRGGSTKLVLSGSAYNVSLAAQMIQEILVNGTGKLLQMPDIASNCSSGGGQGQQQQQYGNPSALPAPTQYAPQQQHPQQYGVSAPQQQQQPMQQQYQMPPVAVQQPAMAVPQQYQGTPQVLPAAGPYGAPMSPVAAVYGGQQPQQQPYPGQQAMQQQPAYGVPMQVQQAAQPQPAMMMAPPQQQQAYNPYAPQQNYGQQQPQYRNQQHAPNQYQQQQPQQHNSHSNNNHNNNQGRTTRSGGNKKY